MQFWSWWLNDFNMYEFKMIYVNANVYEYAISWSLDILHFYMVSTCTFTRYSASLQSNTMMWLAYELPRLHLLFLFPITTVLFKTSLRCTSYRVYNSVVELLTIFYTLLENFRIVIVFLFRRPSPFSLSTWNKRFKLFQHRTPQ